MNELILMERRAFIEELKRRPPRTSFAFDDSDLDVEGRLWRKGRAFQSVDLPGFKVCYWEPFRVRQTSLGPSIRNFPDESRVWLEPRAIIYEQMEDGRKRLVDDLELATTAIECGIGDIDYSPVYEETEGDEGSPI